MKSVLSLISTQDLSKKFGRETLNYFKSTFNHFIYCIAEFLVMLSNDTLHSKRVIKIQDLIKHYDSLLASGHEPETHVIVNSVQIEDDKWKRLSR
ncbi:unnamed protein product [Rotaria sp. Silwood1]|nr:unnamed protein product [Rotaria sp. Silwood1]CAF1680211.1 unnamed protein product [Rotaria sp. Silwood1]